VIWVADVWYFRFNTGQKIPAMRARAISGIEANPFVCLRADAQAAVHQQERERE